MTEKAATLCKAERQNKRTIIGRLFESGSKSFPAFPIRVVFMPIEKNEEAPVSILVSVPKKHFRRAVKRNYVKRQIREAYRKNKHILLSAIENQPCGMVLAFIWLDKELRSTAEVEMKVKALLIRIAERIERNSPKTEQSAKL